ncbi:DNA alkylation repair protein [bacterium]|nr:DNA alkylation repair protein [bacterium]
MAERLKDQFFTRKSLETFAVAIKKQYPEFNKEQFNRLIYDSNWDHCELKQKMRHTTECLRQTLPEDYETAVSILKKAAPNISGFEAMTLPDFVELYGIEHWDLSLSALAHFTRFSSSEFAIRPFLAKKPKETMAFMSQLAESEDEKVRRFASEGCRPRLPWAMALPGFKKDPSLILPILEKLKNDESESVRRSVANNLNDISKDNPDIVLELAEKWFGDSRNTDEIIKHACRTMLKEGNKRALIIFGFENPDNLTVNNLTLSKKSITIGDELHFSFKLAVEGKKECKVRLEYGVYYLKANGKHNRKVFQISEKTFPPGTYSVSRKQSFINMSTRKHHAGKHEISIIVNGEEKQKIDFMLANT